MLNIKSISYLFKVLFFVLAVSMLTVTTTNATIQKSRGEDIRKKHQISGELVDLKAQVDPPISEWVESEKILYQSIFKDKTYDILLVPFQNLARPIGLTSRKIITNRVVFQLRQQSGETIAPIQLVYRSLGNTARYFEDEDVYLLASHLNVKKILWGFVGHYYDKDQKKTMYKFSIICQKVRQSTQKEDSTSKSWSNIPVRPDNFPADALDSISSEIIDFIMLEKKKPNNQITREKIETEELQLPESPSQMVRQSDKHPLIQAYYMQLLGLLTPSYCSLEIQKDFFIRSLALLWQANESHPEVRLLRARAYLYLDQRPKALNIIGHSNSAEAVALKEFVNGNLPSMENPMQQIKSPLKNLMAQLEHYQLKAEYETVQKKPDINVVLEKVPESWKYLVAQKLLDHDNWSIQSNIPLKAIMEKDFPVDGISMETHYKSAVASGELEQKRLEFEMLFLDHLWKAVRSEKTKLFSEYGSNRLSDYDYLLLLRAIGETNLLKYTEFYKQVQGKPEIALQLIDNFLSVFDGHPAFHIQKAHIMNTIYQDSKSLTNRKKSDLVKKIMQNGFIGLWWVGQHDPRLGTYYTANQLRYYENQIKKKKIPYINLTIPAENIYTYVRREYPPCRKILLIHLGFTLDEKIAFIHHNINDLFELANKKPTKANFSLGKLESIKNRFRGNPQWITLQANLCNRSGQYERLEAIYKAGINDNPFYWENYEKLGLEYLRKGDFEKARNLFMEYPPFIEKTDKYNKVALSHDSYMAGIHFFGRGDYMSAKFFYQISADLDTGSSSSLASQARLSLLDGDFNAAAAYSMQRAKRYNDQWGFRDYMSLLHIMNKSDLAWPIFDSLIGRFSTPQIWTSALVGHRINSTSKENLKTWISDKKTLIKGKSNFPARFALLSLVDRQPDISDLKYIGELEIDNIALTPKEEDANIKETSQEFRYIPVQLINLKENTPLLRAKSAKRYQCVAEGYSYLKLKLYDKAFEKFKELSMVENILRPAGRQLMPYIVLSAFKSGNVHLSQQLISQKFIDMRDYDMTLAKAILTGLEQKHTESMEFFHKAFNNCPGMNDRLFFSWYQIVELMEWLYLDSGEKLYLEQALTWAKSHQVIQPMFAWAYAFEAKYTTDAKRKMHALAYAQYLDKESAWISHFTNEERLNAAVWFENNNPFSLDEQSAMDKQQSI